MPMSKEECSCHHTNVRPAFEHKRDKCIAPFVSKSPKTLKRSDVALRMFVAGLSVAALHGIRLRFYVLGELLNQLLDLGHRLILLEMFCIARWPNENCALNDWLFRHWRTV